MLEVNVSSEVEKDLTDLAARNNQNVADFAGKILEKEAARSKSLNGDNSKTENKPVVKKKRLIELAGRYGGGDGKTSQNYKEILLAEVDKVQGFGKD